MARETIHTIEIPLPERLGSAYIERALTPFDARLDAELWALNRPPYHHWNLPLHDRPEDIELGEEILGDIEREATEETATTGRAPRGATTPRTLAWSYAVSCSGAAGVLNSVTTDPIPWPFRIVGFSCKPSDAAVAVNHAVELQLILVDDYQPSVPANVIGESLLPRARALAGAGVLWGMRFIAVTNALASTQQGNQAYATAVIGRTVLDVNKQICLAFQQTDANTASFDGHITVEEITDTAAVTPRVTTTVRSTSITRTSTPQPVQVATQSALPYFGAGAAPRYSGGLFSSSGAKAVTARVQTGTSAPQLGTRWALPEYPGITFATAAEANVYAAARQVSALPYAERAAAAAEVQTQAGRLIYGGGEVATPTGTLVSTSTRLPGIVTPKTLGRTYTVFGR